MANQKINVDIEITSDALNQLPKYKAGFDGLRDALNNLNKKIIIGDNLFYKACK